MPIDLDKIPAAEAYITAVRRFFTSDLESLDAEFNALPSDLQAPALREALIMSFVSQNEGMLEWALSRGLDADSMIAGDYGLAMEISDRLVSRLSCDPKPQFVELVRLAMQRHGEELLTDTITAMTLTFTGKEDSVDQARQKMTRCEDILGKALLSNPDCAKIIFKSVIQRTDHRPLVWDFARRDYLAAGLNCRPTIEKVLQSVDIKDRPALIALFEPTLIKTVSSPESLVRDDEFLVAVMPFATPKMLTGFVESTLGRVRPLRHHALTSVLLHGLKNPSLSTGVEHLQRKVIDTLTSHPTFAELRGTYEPAQVVNSNPWSIRSAARLYRMGHPVSIKSYSFDSIVKELQTHKETLDQPTRDAMRDLLKDELRMDLKKALRTAKKDNPDHGHYLHALDALGESEQIDALVCLCAHEQMILDNSKRGVEDYDIPLLTAARKNVRNPSGNPHHAMRPVFAYLMRDIEDQFKIDLRPKDKKYARAMILGGMITDTRFYSLLTAKERDSKMGADLGI